MKMEFPFSKFWFQISQKEKNETEATFSPIYIKPKYQPVFETYSSQKKSNLIAF